MIPSAFENEGGKVFSRSNSKLNEIPVDFMRYVRYKFWFILNDNHDLTVTGKHESELAFWHLAPFV